MEYRIVRFAHINIIFLSIFLSAKTNAQVSIVSASVNYYNITPRSMCEVSIMNTHQNVQAILEAKLFNSSNELLMDIKTSPFNLHNGLNSTSTLNLLISNTEYGSSNQSNYVKISHILPSGKFNYCCVITVINTDETDEYCLELESDLSSFLLLIDPADKDTIDTPNPDLVWNHSEPFNLLASGEYYRMVVAELTPDQTPEAGISVNIPVMLKNYLHDHNVLYPFEAKTLQPGKRYGWQVQLVTNGVITNKSEAWEFNLKIPKNFKDNKYSILKQTLDGSFYTIENNKLFFRFDESYISDVLHCEIYNSKMQPIKAMATNEDKKGSETILKTSGYNRFEVDLNEIDVSSGFYLLEVKNTKNEKFILRF